MKKLLLILIACSSISLMGMDIQKQVIHMPNSSSTPPSFDPPPYEPCAPPASMIVMPPTTQASPSTNNAIPASQYHPQQPSGWQNLTPFDKVCFPLLCIGAGVFDTLTSPLCCLRARIDHEDDDHRRHSKFTYYFCCCTRAVLYQLDQDSVCGLETTIPDNGKYVYEFQSGGDKMMLDGTGW